MFLLGNVRRIFAEGPATRPRLAGFSFPNGTTLRLRTDFPLNTTAVSYTPGRVELTVIVVNNANGQTVCIRKLPLF